MTINTSSSKTIVLGDGLTTQFAFGFVGVAAAYISVIYTDAAGSETVLAQGAGASQYQIALNAAVAGTIWGVGGTITYDPGSPIPVGSSLTIFRTLPLTQAISLQNLVSLSTLGNGAEAGLDTLEMQLQQVSETFGRAIVAPIVDADSIDLTLPAAAQRANRVLGFDGFGNVIAATAPASGTISSAMQPVVNAASLAAGRTAFGLRAMATEGIGAGLADDGANNARVLPPLLEVATTPQIVTAASHTSNYAATGALLFAFPRANALFDGFYIDVYALTAAVTFAIDSHDNFYNQASALSYTIPKGCFARITTDAVSTWYAEVTGISPKPNVVTITSSGTYTPSAGLLYAVVEAVGPGGSGGGAGVYANLCAGGGGGGGAYARKTLTAAQIGASQTATVGTGGPAGSAGGAGNAGSGATSLGSLVIASAGAGGTAANSTTIGGGAAGGTTGTGDVVSPGGDGDAGALTAATNIHFPAGRGGAAGFGFGAGGAAVTPAGTQALNGNAGKNYGGGGSGAAVDNSGPANGGAGANGVLIITEYLAAVA